MFVNTFVQTGPLRLLQTIRCRRIVRISSSFDLVCMNRSRIRSVASSLFMPLSALRMIVTASASYRLSRRSSLLVPDR